jgi:hypothetical protein
MQSQIHVERDPSLLATARRLLAPTGGAFADGVRLATINTIFLIVAFAAAFILALLGRIIDWALPGPSIGPGLIVLGLSVVFALIVWYGYARKHGQLAQATGRSLHADRFGAIAGAPFGVLALLLLASGLFGLVISVVGLSFGGVSEALGRLIFAVLFGALAIGSVVIARVATRRR